MPLLETGYQHWEGRRRGIWYRRGVIAGSGLRAILASAWVKRLLTLSWSSTLVMIGILFAVGQLIVPDSIIIELIQNLSPRWNLFSSGLRGWLETNPDIAVHAVHNFLFYIFSTTLSTVGFLGIAISVPHLITLDLQSRAILVYSSKALTRFDYFLGKLMTVVALLCLLWLGPLVAAWIVGNVLAPNWKFFLYSADVLKNVLCYTGCGMLVLGVVALGVSATSQKEKTATANWVALWLLGSAIAKLPLKPWLDHVSIGHNLDQLAVHFFNVKADLKIAAGAMEMVDRFIDNALRRPHRMPAFLQDADLNGALIGLGVLVACSVFLLLKRVKPE